MKKLGLDKRMLQLNEALNPELQLDEGVEQGINSIINWVNKNVMKKFWTVDQKEAERKLQDKKIAEMYDDIIVTKPDVAKMIQSNIDRYAIQRAMDKGTGVNLKHLTSNERERYLDNIFVTIAKLKKHHRAQKKKHGTSNIVPDRKHKKKVSPR